MVTVASLLNPMPASFQHEASRSPTQSPVPLYSSTIQPVKKPKMSKAAAIFVKGEPKGEVNYPPFELQDIDEATEAAYEEFDVRPVGEISEYPKRIPYKSEKKSFQQKTGRSGFEVYQYTFRMPKDDREKDPHTVMWDYNVGLTMPAKVMAANPGLRDISHSITGGSISAQGYWVPFEAAKAVAARFCWKIRYVLVPVFGPDFVAMCLKPDEPGFQNLSVGSSIIQRCTERATIMHAQSRESSLAVSPRTPTAFVDLPVWPPKSLRPKPKKAMDEESGYGTDSERSENYRGSPDSCNTSGWTPVNSPSLKGMQHYRFPPRTNITSTPRETVTSYPFLRNLKTKTKKRPLPQSEDTSDDEGPPTYSSVYAPSTPEPVYAPSTPKRRKVSGAMTPEMAARTLLMLNMADATLGERKVTKRRRASA
ncbi:hypothetical protein P7C71_g2017, partial [Lecanoromycetidae sp. Uapishka_2]